MVVNEQAELAAVSAMLHDADCAVVGVSELTMADFTRADTIRTFEALSKQVLDGGATDTVSLCVSFPDRVLEITNCMTSLGVSARMQDYILALKDASQRREVIARCADVKAAAEDWNDSNYLSSFKSIGDCDGHEKAESVGSSAMDAITALYELKMGTRMGFGEIDHLLWGMKPGELIVLGARPGMGKSSFAMNVAVNVARYTGAVAFFSLEMSQEQLLQRSAMAIATVSKQDVLSRDERKAKALVEAGELLSGLPLYISDRSSVTVENIRAYCLRVMRTAPLKLIVVDYLQLLTSSRRTDTREREVAEQTRALKILSREMGCPVLLLSQLSRATDGVPQLKNLRESGAIEQDADVVLFISEDEDDLRNALVTIAKNRSGPTGSVVLAFEKQFCRFRSISWTSEADVAEEVQINWNM